MSAVRRCPGCLHEATRSAGTVGGYDLVHCRRCATLLTVRLPSSAAEATDYEGANEVSLEVPAFVERRLGEIVGTFERQRRLNRWLDVGCGAGALLRAASSLGWEAVGTEVSPSAVEAIRATGLEVHLGRLDDVGLEPGGFDVVSLVEVVEHLADPEQTLRDAARLVRPGGTLYLTTPHGRGLSARLLGTGWSVVAPPEHLQLFSVAGLRALLRRCGLPRARVRTHALNPHELRAGILRRRPSSSGARKETGRQLNESLTSTRLGTIGKDAVNVGLNVLRLGDTLKVTAERPA